MEEVRYNMVQVILNDADSGPHNHHPFLTYSILLKSRRNADGG